MDSQQLRQHLFTMNEIEREALQDPTMPRLFAHMESTVHEDYFLKPDQKIAFLKHPRFMITREHKHEFLEINYVYAGSYVQTINGVRLTLQEGEFCLLDTNVMHTIEPAGENDIIINCMMRKNYFDSDLLRRLSGNHLISEFIINAIYKNKEYNQFILFRSGDNSRIKRIMDEILCEYWDPGICSGEIINSYVMILFSELLRVYQATHERSQAEAPANVLITDILLYLEQNYMTVSLPSVARHFGFHPNYLTRLLKKHMGQPFIKIVQDIKLNKACSILENTRIPIAKIAQDVGISNMNTFYELFQSRFGMTPREYRQHKVKE